MFPPSIPFSRHSVSGVHYHCHGLPVSRHSLLCKLEVVTSCLSSPTNYFSRKQHRTCRCRTEHFFSLACAPGGEHQFHVDFCFASLWSKLFSEFVHFSIRCVLEHWACAEILSRMEHLTGKKWVCCSPLPVIFWRGGEGQKNSRVSNLAQ